MAGPILVPSSALRELGIDLSRDSIRRLMIDGRFPAARRLIEHRCEWVESEVREWIERLPMTTEASLKRPKKSSKGGEQ